jgi:hypothetical protein
MIIRGDFILLNPENLILPIGHLGAKVVLYYLNLESQLHYQRQKDHSKEEHRVVRILDFSQISKTNVMRSKEQLDA